MCLSGLEERRWIEDVSFYSWPHCCCKDDMLDVNERVGATFTFDRKSRPSPSFVTIWFQSHQKRIRSAHASSGIICPLRLLYHCTTLFSKRAEGIVHDQPSRIKYRMTLACWKLSWCVFVVINHARILSMTWKQFCHAQVVCIEIQRRLAEIKPRCQILGFFGGKHVIDLVFFWIQVVSEDHLGNRREFFPWSLTW